MVALALALVEGGSIFLAVCGTTLLLARPLPIAWLDAGVALRPSFAISLCCVVAFYYSDLYNLRVVRSFAQFVFRLPKSLAVAIVPLAAAYMLLPEARTADGKPFAASVLLSIGLLLALRAIAYEILRTRPFTERVLVLGTGPLARALITEIEARPHVGYTIVAVADDAVPAGQPAFRYPLVGPLTHLGKTIQELEPDRIIVALAERRGRLPILPLLESRARRVIVEDGIEVYERITGKLAIHSIRPSNLIFSRTFGNSHLVLTFQRLLNLLASLVGLVVLAPLFAVIALAIKLDSPGPVFFIHSRMGLHGKRFKLVKFRTMHPVTRETSEWVCDNSDRITRVGRSLRKFRLDELPQFVNILRGDMNLVGPRPHPVSNFELFTAKIPYYSLRAAVRPGVTGWAQIRYGYANNLEEEIEKMRYDLYYIKHMSLWFDLRILFDTVKIVLLGHGSATTAEVRVEAQDGSPQPQLRAA